MVFGNTLSQRSGSNRRGGDGVRVEKIPGFTTLGILDEIPKMMAESKCDPEQFKGRIIFMWMYNDIDGETEETENCIANALRITECARRFTQGHWSFLGPGSQRENGTEPVPTNRMENGIKLLKGWCSTLPKADILYFVSAAPWKEENWKSKGKGVKTIHFNCSEETIEVILRTIISFNQLSVHGAVADLCKENEPKSLLQVQENTLKMWGRWRRRRRPHSPCWRSSTGFHDDRVVELRVQLGVEEVEGKDREEQVEVESEKRVKDVRPWIRPWMRNDKTQILSHEVWDDIKCERVRSTCTLRWCACCACCSTCCWCCNWSHTWSHRWCCYRRFRRSHFT